MTDTRVPGSIDSSVGWLGTRKKAEKVRKAQVKALKDAAKKKRDAAAKALKDAARKRNKPIPRPTVTSTAAATPTPARTITPAPAEAPTPAPRPTPTQDVPEHIFASQVDFSSNQLDLDNPVTEFLQTPQTAVELGVFNRDMRFDDGARFEMWSFDSKESEGGFPAPTLRVREGEIFHATVEPSMGPHTVHWHGMEPDPRNDGVGHTSFEIGGVYTYQWQPERGRPGDPNYGAAGTYFYHCHVNTPLHVQMGMFGPLVIDPVVHPDYPVRPGGRRAFVDGPEYDIDTEALICPYSLDPRWHQMDHAAGLSGEDAGLNRFEPEHFYVMGGELAHRQSGDGRVWILSSLRANVEGGDRLPTLLRILNGNYLPTKLYFTDDAGNILPMAELISHDGRPYRDTSVPGAPAPTCAQSGYPLTTGRLAFGAAERYDMIIHPPAPGQYYLRVDWEHWTTAEILATRVIPITAS